MNLAENLQIQRKRLGLSQEELAEKCQVSRQAIAKWENGTSVPSVDKLIHLGHFCNLVKNVDNGFYMKEHSYLYPYIANRNIQWCFKML